MLRILSLSRPRVLGSDCISSERPVIPRARTYDLCRARVKHALSVCFQVFAVLIFGVSAFFSFNQQVSISLVHSQLVS